MTRLIRVLTPLLLLTCSTALGATEWPSFRGPSYDAAISGAGIFENLETPALKIEWRAPIGSGYSGISISGGKVIALFSDGSSDFVAAFDAQSGRELWRQNLGSTYKGHDGSHDGPVASPAIASDRVVILTAQGALRAFALADGKPHWQVDLAADEAAEKPHYGFSASPLIVDGQVWVQHAVKEKHLIRAYDLATGAAGAQGGMDLVAYQSPILATVGGQAQLIVAGAERLYGLDPKSGATLWEMAHEGDPSAMGAQSAVPLLLPGDRILITPKNDTSILVKVTRDGASWKTETLWSSKAIGRSYSRPVYFDGHIYGYVGGFLTCVKADDGIALWRSRAPGDGFLMLVDGRLVVITKRGALHVAQTAAQAYQELAQLEVFADEYSWTAPSYANGRIFVRSMKELAAIKVVEGGTTKQATMAVPPGSGFGRFLAGLGQASDKKKAVDEYLAGQKSLPVVEGDWVFFLFRGEAQDMGIVGDMIGSRVQMPMTRIADTDLFYYAHQLRPAARVSYRFVKDLDNLIVDPLNPKKELGPGQGPTAPPVEQSWVSLPNWPEPTFLENPPRAGRLEKHEIGDPNDAENKRPLEVYLPADYDGQKALPVLYVHAGAPALEHGQLNEAFDRLNGVDPFIAVFIKPTAAPRSPVNQDPEAYTKDLVERVVPFVDKTYKTRADAASRVAFGAGFGGYFALHTALRRPELFGRVATHSAFMFESDTPEFEAVLPAADKGPKIVYFDWGAYDNRAVHEGWDVGKGNARFAEILKAKGYVVAAGGELPEGATWGVWQSRAQRVMSLLFPKN